MAQFKDIMSSSPQGWINELARAEVHPDAEKLLQLGRAFDPQQLVEESTIDFLMELREHFNEFARLFNGYSESGARYADVKIYSIAQTAADFMMFRNQIKLCVANAAHGVIQFAFAQHVRQTVAVDGQQLQGTQSLGSQGQAGQTQDIMAQVGPFRDVYWTFQGEKVTPDQVAKFYFAEFVRATRETRRSKGGNQMLLDQIKALLQEKGLEL